MSALIGFGRNCAHSQTDCCACGTGQRWRGALTGHYAQVMPGFFSYENGDQEFTGYAVFLRQDSPDIGLRRMRLVDFQSDGDGVKFLHDVIEVALSRCHTEGIHVLESIGFGNVRRRQIDALAPYQRQLPSWMFWYKVSAQNPELAKALMNPDVWDPCTYDGDGYF